jgi:hypothetical protein
MKGQVSAERIVRRYADLAQQAGLILLGVEQGKHYSLSVKAGDGRTRKLTTSISASCPYSEHNLLRDMRRFAKGII